MLDRLLDRAFSQSMNLNANSNLRLSPAQQGMSGISCEKLFILMGCIACSLIFTIPFQSKHRDPSTITHHVKHMYTKPLAPNGDQSAHKSLHHPGLHQPPVPVDFGKYDIQPKPYYKPPVKPKTTTMSAKSIADLYSEDLRRFRQFIDRFYRTKRIRTVVDIPCGAWTVEHIFRDWTPVIKYIGADSNRSVIDENRRLVDSDFKAKRGHPSTKFYFMVDSLTSSHLPPADLLNCQDPFKGLDQPTVSKMLHNILPHPNTSRHSTEVACKYKYILITNNETPVSDLITASAQQAFLNFRAEPFRLDAFVVFEFKHSNRRTLLIDLTLPKWNCRF